MTLFCFSSSKITLNFLASKFPEPHVLFDPSHPQILTRNSLLDVSYDHLTLWAPMFFTLMPGGEFHDDL